MLLDKKASISNVFIGIDVSKERLDCYCRPTGITVSYDNTPAGIADLSKWAQAPQPQLIVLEATGGLERPLVSEIFNFSAHFKFPAAVLHFPVNRVQNHRNLQLYPVSVIIAVHFFSSSF